ncbi:C-terminal binding protein [Nocardia beijingensis]|uniref:C-terminal binding protein n=1 Tax=Nocardia beijingensis TaxID=95162 RepID=UPI00331F5DE8
MADAVLITDRAWPDDVIERSVLEAAGLRIVAGPATPTTAAAIEALVAEHRPAAILTCWAEVSAAAITMSPSLRVVARMGVGLDNIDVAAATAAGVLVTNVPDYCVEEVSDHAVAMILAWTRGLVAGDREVRAGQWSPAGHRLRRLSTLTCGVIGFGRIGRITTAKLAALGARVIVSDPTASAATAGVPVCSLDELLSSCDVVVLHAPLTDKTRNLIGARELALLPEGALLVNVSRGGLVDTSALTEALHYGNLGGACLDVVAEEPAVPSALLEHPAVIITPHVAFSSDASLQDLRRSAAEEVVRVLAGQPARHPCNSPTLGRNDQEVPA